MMESEIIQSNDEKPQIPPLSSPAEGMNGHSSSSIPSTLSPSHLTSSDPTIPPSHGTYAEISSNKRYIRFSDLISQDGNIKFSFKAFDTKNGTEIVWQKIILSDLSEMEQNKILESANYLRAVRHQHILVYFDIWMTDKPKTLNLITSYLDTLKQFVNKIGSLRWRIIKKWCKQILQALAYLHNSTPQIIHRNLTWKNIFVNPGVGDLYVGGMWLAAIIVDTPDVPISVSDALSTQYIGSPPYRAPEMAESVKLTTKMDIYSFGMCVLAMVIGADPYSEFEGNSEHIYRLASRGVAPLGLKRIENPQCVDFIESCLKLNPEERLSVEQLFEHPFLQASEENDDKVVTLGPVSENLDELNSSDLKAVESATLLNSVPRVEDFTKEGENLSSVSIQAHELNSNSVKESASSEQSLVDPEQPLSNKITSKKPMPQLSVPSNIPTLGDRVSPNSSSVQVRVSTVPQEGVVTVELRLGEGDTANGVIQDVEFLFNIEQDNYEVVAAEMIQELNLTLPPDQLALLIQQHVAAVLNSSETKKNSSSSPGNGLFSLPDKNLTPETEEKHDTNSSSPSSDVAVHTISNERTQQPPIQSLPVRDLTISQDSNDLQSPRQMDLHSQSDDISIAHEAANGQDPQLLTSHEKIEESAPPESNKSDNQTLIPRPDSDASPEELSDFAELLREIEKIDKECRAARRVFEQRIQKHKIIQDSCEEDLLKIEADYTAQCQQYDKSELKAAQKKDENIALIKAEFDQKIRHWRDSHHSRYLSSPYEASLAVDHPSTSTISGMTTYSTGSVGILPERIATPSLGSSGASFNKPKS